MELSRHLFSSRDPELTVPDPPLSPLQQELLPAAAVEVEAEVAPGVGAYKANGLYPVEGNRNAFWHCLNGIMYLQNCQAGLVFDASCDCCNWL